MATSAVYASTPLIDYVQAVTANTARDGTGTIATLASGTAAGKLIRRIIINATGTTTAGVIRFFLSLDTGTTKRLIKEVLVTAKTPSTSVDTFRAEVPELVGMILPGTAAQLYVSTHNTETFNIVCESGGI